MIDIKNTIKLYIFPFLSVIGVCAVFALPIWYGSWYPAAQDEVQRKIAIEENKNISEIAKPDFWIVSKNHIFDFKSPVVYCALALLLITLTQWHYFKLSKDFSKLKDSASILEDEKRDLHGKINEEQESHAETRQLYYESLKEHIRRLCESSGGYIGDRCRASIYRIDREQDVARLIFRCSGISKYENKGRVSIPLSEGVVAATAQNGDYVYISVPGTRYANKMKKELAEYGVTVSDATLSTIQMKSNTYYGRAIRDLTSGDKVAILVMESLDANAFDKNVLNSIFEAQNNDFTKWVRHIARIDSVLNPYGGKS